MAIEPGSMVGVLGGGQLGAMFAVAARRLGYRVAVWDQDADAPALKIADLPVSAPFTDPEALARFAGSICAVTYEWENIPIALSEALEQRLPVRPASDILRILQHRVEQKRFLASYNIPVAPFRPIAEPGDLPAAAESIGFPCLCKTATHGYDGKGQWRLAGAQDLASVQEQLSRQAHSPWVLEQFVGFEKELSVLVVRGADGDRRVYPTVENVHEAGILRTTRVPAEISPRLAQRAGDLAASVVEALEGVGVFCVELFLMPDDRLFVNEIAPRPHNSGHYTLDACTVSQFEQQVRAVCGLPLGDVRLLCPAVMVNLIGEDCPKVSAGEGLANLLRQPGAMLHLYGKKSVRPGRKMGHVTFLAEKPEQAWESSDLLQRLLAR
ncbi:MAG: 5-(carboxyamino)imidazole ribonucleotide synthase [Nitrospirota bacterium]|nr:5-(carboxyamino)imidazole ribonucleotide synthase [Nitrospirota bacterium]